MNNEPQKRNPVTLDDLFALKRAERPDDEFWTEFQRELHVRQRAEAIEPKRWWFVLPRVFAQLSRYQMPLGATAVLAVTFLSFRDYREPGFEVVYSAPTAPITVEATPVDATSAPVIAEVVAAAEPLPEVELPSVKVVATAEPLTAPVNAPVPASADVAPHVGWAGAGSDTTAALSTGPTPSQLSIAANLAKAKEQNLAVGQLFSEPEVNLTAAVVTPVQERRTSRPQSSRERLFVYQGTDQTYAQNDQANAGPDTHGMIARSISHDELYESVSRIAADADRLTLKF